MQVSDFQLAPVVSVRTRALVVVLTRVDDALPPLVWPAEQLAVLQHTRLLIDGGGVGRR